MNLMSGIGTLHESTSPNTITMLSPNSFAGVLISILIAFLSTLNPWMT